MGLWWSSWSSQVEALSRSPQSWGALGLSPRSKTSLLPWSRFGNFYVGTGTVLGGTFTAIYMKRLIERYGTGWIRTINDKGNPAAGYTFMLDAGERPPAQSTTPVISP
jgi:hypothetical protein